MLGVIPNEDARWNRLNNYYFNCLQDVDRNLVDILDELDALGIADNTIVIFTADHGELGGAHGLVGKGANAYREQNHVPLTAIQFGLTPWNRGHDPDCFPACGDSSPIWRARQRESRRLPLRRRAT